MGQSIRTPTSAALVARGSNDKFAAEVSIALHKRLKFNTHIVNSININDTLFTETGIQKRYSVYKIIYFLSF